MWCRSLVWSINTPLVTDKGVRPSPLHLHPLAWVGKGPVYAVASQLSHPIPYNICTRNMQPEQLKMFIAAVKPFVKAVAVVLLLLLLQIRTQPHLGCCLAAATAAASAKPGNELCHWYTKLFQAFGQIANFSAHPSSWATLINSAKIT
jgi:hypothetical protein